MTRLATRKASASAGKATAPSAGAGTGHTNEPAAAPGQARPPAHQPVQQETESLEQYVFRSLEQYFADLGGAKPHALHQMVLGAIEKPLLLFALQRCDGNQSAAAELLGINRNTLRRKLQDYGLH